MAKSADVELTQLKMAIQYLMGLLEEGSLVEKYDKQTREEIAVVLDLLVQKVAGLPNDLPDHLVKATAVRAIVGASEQFSDVLQQEKEAEINRNMREAETTASIQGHMLGPWELVAGSELEYQATCRNCGGFVYVSHSSTYDLLLDTCRRVEIEKR